MHDATASTVGRDSDTPNVRVPPVRARWFHAQGGAWIRFADEDDAKLERWWEAVSYTHLTLPTILLV